VIYVRRLLIFTSCLHNNLLLSAYVGTTCYLTPGQVQYPSQSIPVFVRNGQQSIYFIFLVFNEIICMKQLKHHLAYMLPISASSNFSTDLGLW
jgi:hypothetical protein